MMTGSQPETRVKQKLAVGQLAVGVTINFPHAGLAEYLGLLGFDCVVIDAEHGSLVDADVAGIVLACDLTGCASILRINADASLIERYMNMGLTGIQLPRVQSSAQVQEVVNAVKFAPIGQRGLGNGRTNSYGLSRDGFPALMEATNARTVIMVQIEDLKGIGALPDIVGIQGVDVILVGAADLSNDLGVPGDVRHPAVVEASKEIERIAHAAGKPIGIGANVPEEVAAARNRGARYVLTSVVQALACGATPLVQAAVSE
jgi:4-hydroxy-2-oxoheptanedioate aldolase